MPAPESRPEGRGAASVRALAVVFVVALLVFLLDQGSKHLITENLAVGERVSVLGEVLHFVFVKNSGAAFSLAAGWTWIFSIVASGVAVFIAWYAPRIRSTVWLLVFGMLLGGTLGNLADRLFREPSFGLGHVVDFIQVWGFPAIFNVADIFIVSSMGLFILLTLMGLNLDGTRARGLAAAGTAAEAESPAPPTPER
ncbi:MAG: signal peptidase II [Cryobacterium sp.]|nr:signal peptidase II [Cryobacterium sp.]